MAISAKKVDVWAVDIPDAPGGLAARLAGLAEASVNLEFLMARRQPEQPGRGVAFIVGIKGAKADRTAKTAGFQKATMAALRVDAPDKPGLCHRMLSRIAQEGINVRGVSASTIGRKCVVFLAFDSAADADQSAKVLRRL